MEAIVKTYSQAQWMSNPTHYDKRNTVMTDAKLLRERRPFVDKGREISEQHKI